LSPLKTLLVTTVALLAFAGNSLLCRLALGQEAIDAASFSTIRILSGAATLALIAWPRWRRDGRSRIDWRTAGALFVYVVFFSFAYLTLSAGTGALILFGAVQLTMFIYALTAGERFTLVSWLGLGIAFGGLVYLVSPGLTAPDPLGALLMAIAGLAWGAYSLLGRSAGDPLAATANNFIGALPLALLVSVLFLGRMDISPSGALLAVASGAITSGLGYVVWYAALRGLTAGSAASVQLSVPVIAAIGGVILLGEDVSARLALASAATLGGIALVLAQRTARRN
jgi:drug/metabolite transporter (DMT)-like permease